jgi:TolB-like protein
MAYMSPEQAEGKPVDGRSDVFSFGAVLHEMITGRRAFQRESSISTLVAVLREDAPSVASLRGGVSTALDHVIGRCLRKDPARRFQSMTEVKSALEDVRAELSSVCCSASVVPETPSIAVLPFSNLSADKENEYFGDGLAEEIINALTRVEGLRVIARTSSFRFRGDLDLKDVGEKLSVRHVLEGSVRKAGTRIRVTAQLISIADESHLWSQRYDREFQDIFEIQDEIARAIVEELKLKLAPSEPVSHAALRARGGKSGGLRTRAPGPLPFAETHARRTGSRESVFRASHQSGSELRDGAHQPERILVQPGGDRADASTPGFRDRARRRGQSARARPHAARKPCHRGRVLMNHEYDWEGARREFEIALAFNPSSVIPRAHLAHMLVNGYGRYQEAAANMQRVLELDPVSPAYRAVTGCYFLFAGNTQRAIEESTLTLQTDPAYHWAHWTLGMSYSDWAGMTKPSPRCSGRSSFRDAIPSDSGRWRFLHARAGHADEPRQLLDQLEAVAQTRLRQHFRALHGVSRTRPLDDALKAFETSIENRDFTAQWFRHTPFRAHLQG